MRSRPWPTPLAPGDGPALQIIAQAGVRHASCTNMATCANTPGRSWHACLCPLLPEPGCSHLTVTPLPTSPIPAAPGVGRQLGQASACGSPGHKRQAGDRSTEFFKALMESASQDLGPGTRDVSGTPPSAMQLLHLSGLGDQGNLSRSLL